MTIFVGSQKTRFDVHQDQLCEVSIFFKAAFTSHYKESLKKSIDLLEDDADTVDLFVQWLYKQQLNHLCHPADDGGEYLMQPIRLWIFADKYDIQSLKLYTLEKLLAHIPEEGSAAPSMDVVEYAYRNTCRGSGIRILLAEWLVTYNGRIWFQSRSTQDWLLSNPEIAVDLVAAFSKIPDEDHVPDHIKNNEPEYYMKVRGDDSSSDSSGGESTGISAK